MKKLKYFLLILLMSFVISLPLILPYFREGYFPTHDGEWAVVRLSEMYREFKSLAIPARYSTYLNFQYGYPLFNFTYPLPYYLGLIFVFLKLGFITSIKILFTASVVLSFLSMFFLAKNLWRNNMAGFVCAAFYIYVPYHIVDLFVRGSLGESLSFVLFPLILLWVKRIYEKPNSIPDILMFGILYSLLILTHNIMAVLFGLVLLLVFVFAIFKKNISFLLNLIISIILSLCLSAFFWIPALAEKNLILLSEIPIADRSQYFVNLSDLIIPKWGYGTPTDINGFGYQIGIPYILVFITVFFLVLLRFNSRSSRIAIYLILSTLVISLLLFSFSSVIWSYLPLLSEINYPWTLLAVITFLISLLAGYLTTINKKFTVMSIFLAILAFVLVIPHASPQSIIVREDSFYTTNQATTTSSNELMPLWVKKMPKEQASEKVELLDGNEKIKVSEALANKISFNTLLEKERTVQVNLIYYPGWNAYVNGVSTRINYDNEKGVIRLGLKKGSNDVNLRFEETSLRSFSNYISIISFMVTIILFWVYRKKIWNH